MVKSIFLTADSAPTARTCLFVKASCCSPARRISRCSISKRSVTDATEDDVIAGVRVTGTADEPKAEIFSDPAMPQAEALSYLLRGQGLDSNQSDSAAMTSMLIGLGVAQSGQVVGKIGETFGVSNLALDTQGVGDSSQVVVSGYVLPGLQVKYGVGIFDSLATLTLRYRLMPKLYLEAVSGVDQALDLLYQFEF